MRRFPKIALLVFFTGSLLLISCGNDRGRYVAVDFVPHSNWGVRSAPPVVRHVRITPRPRYGYGYNMYPQQYGHPYQRYGRWQYSNALEAYFGCRAPNYTLAAWGRYGCSVPYTYRYYERVANWLDFSVSDFLRGKRHRGRRYLGQALEALPSDNPLIYELEDAYALSNDADLDEVGEATLEVLDKVADEMMTLSSSS